MIIGINKENLGNATECYGIYAAPVIPGTTSRIYIEKTEDILTVRSSIEDNRKLCVVYKRQSLVEESIVTEVSKFGTYCSISSVLYEDECGLMIEVYGIDRCEVIEVISILDDPRKMAIKIDDAEFQSMGAYESFMEEKLKEPLVIDDLLLPAIGHCSYSFIMSTVYELRDSILKIMANPYIPIDLKQMFLESGNWSERYDIARKNFLITEEEFYSQWQQWEDGCCYEIDFFSEKIEDNAESNAGSDFKEQEQQNVLKEEIVKDKNSDNSIEDEYKKKLEELNVSEDIKEKLQEEINRLKIEGRNHSADIRTYLNVVFSIPFGNFTEDRKEFKEIQDILNQDQYGLAEVKERILDYLAVKNLNPDSKGTILCLAGPPGTGKTSIVKSIAKALGRNYIRISLGGLQGEFEARGTDRSYRYPHPGRFIDALINTKAMNPLILLDEIDKVSKGDYNGNLESALLEVLDPGQNPTFRDNYLEFPIDLSKVLFIATANDLSTISRPLLDRMEVINISSYTEDEKLHIAKYYLLREEIKEAGLKEENLSITDEAIKKIISNYTREAGVRNLKRKIETICRKKARNILDKGITKTVIEADDLEDWIGKEIKLGTIVSLNDEIGVVKGLVYNGFGGAVMHLEVNISEGNGGLKLTGSLGNVIKESGHIALSYIRSIADEYGIEKDFFNNNEIHLHIPSGSIPKDGPSAGVAIACAFLSAIIGKKVKGDIAMTGEITLKGKVLAVGGLREKILAAKQAGIKTIIAPKENETEIIELGSDVLADINIELVENFTEVSKLIFA